MGRPRRGRILNVDNRVKGTIKRTRALVFKKYLSAAGAASWRRLIKGQRDIETQGKKFPSPLPLNWRYEDLTKCTGTIVTTYDPRLSNKEKNMKKSKSCLIFILLTVSILVSAVMSGEPINITSSARGAKIVAFSSNYGGSWDVNNLIDTNEDWQGELPAWCSESEAPFPHWAVIELPKKEWLTTLIFNNVIPDESAGWTGISAKDVRVEVSTVNAQQGFKSVASFQLELNKNSQLVRIDPIEARWIKLVITSNWGNEEYTELGQLGVFDDGNRSKNIAEELKSKGFIDVYGIYFDFGSAQLRPESDPVLKQIAGYLKENPAVKVTIEGHTDNVGNEKANQLLSENRARSVVAALGKLNVAQAMLTAAGFGASKPVGDNTTITGRARNRRVTVRVVK